jgi:nicotinamidase/pyrazinamidase
MKAMILVDIQNDFVPAGPLAVSEGDRIVPVVNELQKKFDLVLATQDWHPANHGSFAANHPGRVPGDRIELNGLEQILWPVHCVQNTAGAEARARWRRGAGTDHGASGSPAKRPRLAARKRRGGRPD